MNYNFEMASLPILTVLEQCQVSPPPATVDGRSLPLTFFDILFLHPIFNTPAHQVFFYDFQLITKAHFIQTILPNLNHSLSLTLQHFFPFAGKLVVFPTLTKKPEIRYVDGDSVPVTFAECSLDFDDLTGNHPRGCEKFYHLIPLHLGESVKVFDHVKIPLLSIQVTLFPNRGISIGLTNRDGFRTFFKRWHHLTIKNIYKKNFEKSLLFQNIYGGTRQIDTMASNLTVARATVCPSLAPSMLTNHHILGDARTRFCFLKAWTSIARSGTDESFLANGTLPVYDRLVNYPKLDESYLKFANVETVNHEEYRPKTLSRPTDKVRATFVLTRTTINRLKKQVSTDLPTLAYVSSFTVACGYIWSCIAGSRNDERELLTFAVDCRARLDPPIPAAYFGNCVRGCRMMEKASLLTGKEGFMAAVKLIGENLHKMLTDKDGIVKDVDQLFGDLFANGMPTTVVAVAGTPKVELYDLDFGWGKPRKHELISIDFSNSISLSSCKESNEDLEIGVVLSAIEMEAFIRMFHDGLEAYL
ncbi:hypothetical protein OSB04_021416 [Centaurea solstitialis]|uniref:Uncharacterized protein n=1 Tax=Centaurea solstitialis TaxID=347529 RepID=A0AA38TDV9_9ASTR|nr:hypothetical protein OSB04_021416 [Centaurea solstitialis]